ncbi:MAG TPA: KamA family radical SAM protein [Candidatus Rhabdochlamydia sp.]|jgi:EF-P beta-lysylation protein EpmB|nr:KamA family radical SAM protein [Candidatus Rhabdochlamydia sp.]
MSKIPYWRAIQKKSFTNWRALLSYLELSLQEAEKRVLISPHFVLNLPYRLAQKMKKGDWKDPLLLQFLPLKQELHSHPLFVSDPVLDSSFTKTSKLLHKYTGRALLLCTSACAMHCRYCFRQNFAYEKETLDFKKELEELAQDSSLTEIILSGGDPLSLSNVKLEYLLQELNQIPHIQKIRFHTRFPIGIPERIDAELISMLSCLDKQVIFVIHSNHPKELDGDIFTALKQIQKLGIPLLCQTVLLHQINDDIETLVDLFTTLSNQGILPYYLHQLDQVKGTQHFETSIEKGRELVKQLSARLPGYCVPKYVQEIPNQPNKTLIDLHSFQCL